MAINKDSTAFILRIAIILSLICATLVSLAFVSLKSIQDANALKEKQLNILMAAGIYTPGADISKLYNDNIEMQVIDLKTGDVTDAVNAETYDPVKAAKLPDMSQTLDPDPARLGKRIEKYEVIYLLKENGKVKRAILPIRGYGLWGTMFGFLAMDKDGKTIEGITFYQHKETPGLGAEIANPNWQALWVGKKPYQADGVPKISLVKTVSPNADVASRQIDMLAGSTLTSRGVERTVNFWLGNEGYGPYLQKLAKAQ